MGTLYRRFPTKELLITELVLELTSELRDLALDCLNRTDGSGLETFLFSAAQLQSSNLGCLTRLWRDSMSPELLAELRGVITALVADARSRHTLRPEVTPADISVVLWSLRGVIETARDVAPDAWRRQLEIVMAGLRPNDHVLKQPPLNQSQLDRIAFAAR
jgi:AcrR family transcriptional regulator